MNFLHAIAKLFLLIAGLVFLACESTLPDLEEESLEDLELIASYPLQISDPSGLTLDISGDFLWTVSDDPGDHIYQLSFTGEILGVLTGYEGDDMEGITMNPNDGTLWVAEEKLRQIVQLTTEGEVLQVVDVPVESNNLNDGLEGIAWNPENDHVFILNEKHPRKFIELNNDFEIVRYEAIEFDTPYEMTDLSGLFYLQENEEFWIVSDESEKIVVTDPDLNPLRGYSLPYDKFEGIAVDYANGRLYLVNDRRERLYVYKLPD
jgi:uncharacterized protein YjiK